jgi:formamidopyrimidine-DNA glycosylase
MPELPEVETVRRALVPALEGTRVIHVEVRHPRLARRNEQPADVGDRLIGRVIHRVGRRGKFLLVDVEGDLTWVTHLGMSGRIELAYPGELEKPHTHVVVGTERGQEMRMVDPRTFGFMAVYTPEELARSTIADLGPDALHDLPPTSVWAQRLAGRKVAIKTLLLDQRLVAGLGNIYADEVLHRAGIRPHRRAGSLTREEVNRLRTAVRPVLRAGLRWGGTSLGDLAYLLPDGRAGGYLNRLRAYGREGLPCRRDGTPIERTVIGGRSSFWCPQCQR